MIHCLNPIAAAEQTVPADYEMTDNKAEADAIFSTKRFYA